MLAFAAPIAPLPPRTEYAPGVCNIGPDEIARRRRAGHMGALAALGLFVGLLVIGAPPVARLLVALPAAGAAVGYLQARLKFCVAFASLGVFNLGSLGHTERVVDPDARARDRVRAWQITVGSAVVGLLVGAVAALLPV